MAGHIGMGREAMSAAIRKQQGLDARVQTVGSVLSRDTAGMPNVFKRAHNVLGTPEAFSQRNPPKTANTVGTHGIRPLEETDDVKRCWVDVKQIATRQCFTCSKYDPNGTGYFCEESFARAHPWHRMDHKWVYLVQKPEVPKPPKLTKGEQTYQGVADVLQTTIEQKFQLRESDETSTTHEDRAQAAQHCDDLLVRMLKMMETLRDDEKRRKNLAAIRIQKAFRRRRAWRRMRTAFRMTWNQVFDPQRGVHYYVNRRSGETIWNRPMLVGVPVPIPDYPERLFTEFSLEEAVTMIVGMFRRTAAQKLSLTLAKALYKIVRDPNTGSKYYYNRRTGESTWVRPKMLGPERVRAKAGKTRRTGRKLSQRSSTRNRSVRSSRSGRALVNHATRSKVRVGYRSQDLSESEAVIKLQAWARWCLAKPHIWSLVELIYEKVYDPGNDAYFYFNSRTETSSWIKPKVFGKQDLEEVKTERIATTGRKVSGMIVLRTARRAENLSAQEAAVKIASFFKLVVARRRAADIAFEQWDQVWDENEQEFFYFNKTTEESTWDKPLLLQVVDLSWSHQAAYLRQPESSLVLSQGVRSSRRAEKLTRVKAAIKCQSFARFILARARMWALALEVYEKCIDPDYHEPYYFNKKSFESSWIKPVFFFGWDLPITDDESSMSLHMRNTGVTLPRLGRRREDLTPKRAALMVQKMFRMRCGWRKAIRQARLVLEKVWSEDFQAFYYHNKRTDESTWEKPLLLGNQDLAPTPRSHAAAVQAGVEPVDGPLARNGVRLTPRGTNFILGPLKPPPNKAAGLVRQAEQMSEDEACIRIQSAFRAAVARKAVRKLIKAVFERVWDPESSAHYFYNTNTGESSWEEPYIIQRMLGVGHSLVETPRDLSLAVRFNAKPANRAPRTGRRAEDLSPEAACLVIQSAARMWVCRLNIVAVVQARIRKCFHERFGAFFYYDTRRHSATWFKPSILRKAELRETSETDLAEEVRRLLPGLANAPDEFALSAAAPQDSLPIIAELSASEASRISTARSTSSSVRASTTRPLSAVPSWRPNWDDSPDQHEQDPASGLNLQLTQEKIRSLHLRQLRMFALAHAPHLGGDIEDLYTEHGEGVWEVLGKTVPAAEAYQESVEESKKLTLRRLQQAVAGALRGQNQLTTRVVEAEVSSASAVAAARRASQGKRTSLAALAASIRSNNRTIKDPMKRENDSAQYNAAAAALPKALEVWTAPIKEVDEGDDDESDHSQSEESPLGTPASGMTPIRQNVTDPDAAIGAARSFFASLGSQTGIESQRIQGTLLGTSATAVIKMKRDVEASTPRPLDQEVQAMEVGSRQAVSGATTRREAFESAAAELPVRPIVSPSPEQSKIIEEVNKQLHLDKKVSSATSIGASKPSRMQGEQKSQDMSSTSQLTQTLHSYASDVDVVTRILDYENILKRWARRFDGDEGRFFYLNLDTGETSWDRPAEILEFAIPLSPRTQMAYDIFEKQRKVEGMDRRKKAEHLSAEEAALSIQCAFRCAKASKVAKFKARNVYKKAYDESTKGTYYWNPRTERSAWIKPKLLGSDDVRMTPRTRLPGKGMVNPDGSKPAVRQALNSTTAATLVQSFVRLLKARRAARARCRAIMQKVIDEETAYPYYFNTVTGEAQWHKPRILGEEDLDISAVSARGSHESLK